MGDYKKDGDVQRFDPSPTSEAVAWQGYDDFVGIDSYRKEIFEKGTVLVKMEPSNSGYFTTQVEYGKFGQDSKGLSEAMQLQPWYNQATKEYLYRSKASFWVLRENVEVAVGDTTANRDYGKGGIKQVFVAGFDPKNPSRHRTGAFLERTGEETLSNYSLTKKEGETITAKHGQHVLKRNYFCALRQKDRLLNLARTTESVAVKKECLERVGRITKHCERLDNRLGESFKQIGNVPSRTYDANIRHLTEKLDRLDKVEGLEKGDGKQRLPDSEKPAISKLNANIMGKVGEEIDLILAKKAGKGINVDDLRLTYNNNLFVAHKEHVRSFMENRAELDELSREKLGLQAKIEENTKSLTKVGQHFKTVADHGKIAKKYEDRTFLKNSFYKRHAHEIERFNESKRFLEARNISSLPEYEARVRNGNEKIKRSVNELGHKSTRLLEERNGIEQRLKTIRANIASFQQWQQQVDRPVAKEKNQGVEM